MATKKLTFRGVEERKPRKPANCEALGRWVFAVKRAVSGAIEPSTRKTLTRR